MGLQILKRMEIGSSVEIRENIADAQVVENLDRALAIEFDKVACGIG
jgi:hypothetical protein